MKKVILPLAILSITLCLNACENYADRGFVDKDEEAALQAAGYETFDDFVQGGKFVTVQLARECHRLGILTVKQCEVRKLEDEAAAVKHRAEKEKERAEKEKEHEKAKRRDGIFSQGQAFSKCKGEFRSAVNNGYFDYLSDYPQMQKNAMSSHIDRCMHQYGYTGR
jgi:hypothetical protein